jgi:hypothetical protein
MTQAKPKLQQAKAKNNYGAMLLPPDPPVGLKRSSMNHHPILPGVHQPATGPQLCVDAGAVSLAIPVDVLPLMLTNWMDHCPIIPALSRWSQVRVSQPTKTESVTSYKNEYT